ncbi:MAG: M20/M25/M40 family metallo-hydrolase [Thermomicrobiales bacterium]
MNHQQARAALEQRLERDADDILGFVQKIVQIPSENPDGDTTQLVSFLTDWMDERGLDHEIVAPQPTMPNVLAGFDGGDPGKHLILNGHLDIFPAGDPTQWSDDPYSGAVRDGKLFGRGVIDMKTGTAASFLAYRYLHEMRQQLGGRLTLTAVSDEETGGTWGTGYLMDNYPDVIGDCVLNGEPSTPYTIRFGEKGPVWLDMLVRTPGGHGAYTHLSKSAIQETAEIIGRIERLADQPVTLPADILAVVEAARPELDAALGAGATDIVKQVTVNIGTIRGGVKTNVIAADCYTGVDLRAPVGHSAQSLLEQFEAILADYPDASYELFKVSEPSVCTPDHEMVRILQRNGEAVRGIRPKPAISIGGTDCRFWRWRGIPAYVYGPIPYNMGAADEYVTLDDLYGTVRVHVLSAFDYLTGATD